MNKKEQNYEKAATDIDNTTEMLIHWIYYFMKKETKN